MKKMLLATAHNFLLQDVLNRRLLFKTNRHDSTKETITHHFFVSGVTEENSMRKPKICGGAENVVKKQKPSKHS